MVSDSLLLGGLGVGLLLLLKRDGGDSVVPTISIRSPVANDVPPAKRGSSIRGAYDPRASGATKVVTDPFSGVASEVPEVGSGFRLGEF